MPLFYFQVDKDGASGERQGLQLNDIADSRRMLEAQKALRHAAPLELEP